MKSPHPAVVKSCLPRSIRCRLAQALVLTMTIALFIGKACAQICDQVCGAPSASAAQPRPDLSGLTEECREFTADDQATPPLLPVIRQLSEFQSGVPREWTSCAPLFEADNRTIQDLPGPVLTSEIKQRLMDIYSWKTFVALNWPVAKCRGDFDPGKEGWETCPSGEGASAHMIWGAVGEQPLKSGQFSPRTPLRWMTWHDSRELGGTDRSALHYTLSLPLLIDTNLADFGGFVTGRIGNRLQLTDTKGPLSHPVIDQNGNQVYYQIVVNQSQFDSGGSSLLCENCRYHAYLKGLLSADALSIDFKYGNNLCVNPDGSLCPRDTCEETDRLGAVELKLAWKILTAREVNSGRFIQESAIAGGSKRHVGLVAMHIAHKTKMHQEWIWSSFEQVDNLTRSFYNTKCPGPATCAIENCPPAGGQYSQLTRPPLDPQLASLNARVQRIFARYGSVLEYYQLIGTQYRPLDKESVLSNLAYPSLRNPVIEPYVTCRSEPSAEQSCIGCHGRAAIPPPVSAAGENCRPGPRVSETPGAPFLNLCHQRSCGSDCSFLVGQSQQKRVAAHVTRPSSAASAFTR
jgi:hypothetical protein